MDADEKIEHGLAAATALDATTTAAVRAYLSVLARNPRDFSALNDLGTVLFEAGYRRAARTAYETAVQHHPARAMGHVNLANLLAETGETAAARAHYRAALAAAPDDADAHRGLAALLADDGDQVAAAHHRRIAYARQPVMPQPFRGTGPGMPLLLLIGAAGGNLPTRPLIDTRHYRVTALAPEFVAGRAPLPPHALVFNAIGDPDLARPALDAAQALLLQSDAPVINAPSAVLRTGRVDIARRLAGLADVIVPAIASHDRAALASRDGAALVARDGFGFPLLLRSPGFHTGRHFVRVDTAAQLADAARALPGETLLVIAFLDARGADGLARKYRVMMVDDRLYPLHLAIAPDWKVHYVTSAMAARADLRTEEAAFLAAMPGVLGARAMAGLAAIVVTLGLDYGGIDCAVAADGRVIVFEANATMAANPPDADPRWDYRRAAATRVHDAVAAMLAARCRATSG